MREIQVNQCHNYLKDSIKPAFSYDEKKDFERWKTELGEKFIELVGIENIKRNACPLHLEIESEEEKDGYKQIRFVFESENGAFVPCYLLIPNTGKEKYPVAITLQGHSTGFHNSIGVVKYERDVNYQPRGAFALQAIKHGYAALAIEQRGLGERTPPQRPEHMCHFEALNATLLGRTILGERMWDVSKAIDLLSQFERLDTEKIFITGNSGGGTMSYYAACFDKRIKFTVPSCSFSGYKTSIMSVHHCSCNYIPKAYENFEMQDLCCLIAPRPLVAVTGVEDNIFPIEGVRDSFATVQAVYERIGAPENCRLIETPKGHWWCEDIVWNAIDETVKKLGW